MPSFESGSAEWEA